MRVPNAFPHSSWRLLLTLLLLTGTGALHAQSTAAQGSDANDPPARVARIDFANGDLGLLPAGSTSWTAADINRPLTNGDKLSSGPGARSELDLGGAALRLDGQSDVGILNLNGQTGQFELTQGTLNLSVRTLDEGATYEIDTPTLALVISQPGSYRVDVPADGSSTTVAVNDDLATVYGENNAQRQVFNGRRYQFTGSALTDVTVTDITGSDAFDLWCSTLDTRQGSDASTQYVSNDMVGADDLDGWGSWEEDADYGAIWYPVNVVAGWAPYRFGHWVWIAPWGWTWVDNLPWGFAPYHYGRWVFVRNHWGWIPGPRQARPVYAPALVGFVGGGAGHPVGWFPLGPHDIYNPWYHASRNYYAGVNLANLGAGRYEDRAALLDAIHRQYGQYQAGHPAPGAAYAYRTMPAALTAVSAQTFAGAGNVRSNQVHLSTEQIAAAPALAPASLQHPGGASFGQPRLLDARPLPSSGFNRQVVAVGRPSGAVISTASARTGQPASNVRILTINPNAPVVSRTPNGGNAQALPAPRPAMPTPATPPAMLPQVPHFQSAQQMQPAQAVEQAMRYQPTTRTYAPREQDLEQQRDEAIQRSHQFVPEQRLNPNPSYEPYARPDFARPAPQGHPYTPEGHPQSGSSHSSSGSSHSSAPAAAHNQNGH
ncbi:DUF6600 domain-containing protein [Dyella acidiphila]|uniref:FecR protein domain-containing protein n=1 Tax=Dyella acidiphila TaxID=2775866 RepID=A0ABR9G4G1_9GAMM|nr:DUF6600 domain-containing protein [Dyella acidiphila]MBE1158911.1 hypothetical protein [Dyella acidiphila]